MFGVHVLDPRHLGVEMPVAVPAEMMTWAPHVVPLPRTVTRKIEVAVITGPVGGGILLVLTKGSIVWKPSLTTIAIRHLMVGVQGLKEEYVTYRKCELGIYMNRVGGKLVYSSKSYHHHHMSQRGKVHVSRSLRVYVLSSSSSIHRRRCARDRYIRHPRPQRFSFQRGDFEAVCVCLMRDEQAYNAQLERVRCPQNI